VPAGPREDQAERNRAEEVADQEGDHAIGKRRYQHIQWLHSRIKELLTINPHGDFSSTGDCHALRAHPISLIFFSLYLAAALVGISLEALAQIYPH